MQQSRAWFSPSTRSQGSWRNRHIAISMQSVRWGLACRHDQSLLEHWSTSMSLHLEGWECLFEAIMTWRDLQAEPKVCSGVQVRTWCLLGSEKSACLQCRILGLDPGVGKIPWRREWLPTPVFLPGECHGQRNLLGSEKEQIILGKGRGIILRDEPEK